MPVIERRGAFGGAPRYVDPKPRDPALYPYWKIEPETRDSRFAFNGEPLVPICEIGSVVPCSGCDDGAMPDWAGDGWFYFRLENESSFSRFFWSPDRLTWRVQLKGGDILEFGRPIVTRHTDDGDGIDDDEYSVANPATGAPQAQTGHFRWNLVRSFTPAAGGGGPRNVVVYRWAKLGRTGRGYLTDVYYTPPANPGVDRPPLDEFAHHVHLSWTLPPQIRNTFAPIWRAVPDHVLTGVDVSSKPFRGRDARREMVRRYHLDYSFRGQRSYLTSFQEEGRCAATVVERDSGILPDTNCDRRPAVRLRYSEPESNRIPSSVLLMPAVPGTPLPSDDLHLIPVDANGDSLPDFVESDPAKSTFAAPEKNDRKLFLYNGVWHEEHTIAPAHSAFTKYGYTVTGDFTSDGRLGLLYAFPKAPTADDPNPINNGFRSKVWLFEKAPSGDWKLTPRFRPTWGLPWTYTQPDPFMGRLKLVGDVNGDGLIDLLNYGDTEYPGYGFGPSPFKPNSTQPAWDKSGDIATAFGARYLWGGPTAAPGEPYHSELGFTTVRSCVGPSWADMDGDWDADARSVHLADMDADSLADLVVVGRSQVRFWPSTGRGDFTACRGAGCSCTTPTSSAEFRTFLPHDLGPDPDPARIRLADVNGDGHADLVSWDKAGLRVSFNVDGWRFEPPIFTEGFWFSPDWAKDVADKSVDVQFADTNANGLTDVVVSAHNRISALDLHRIGNIAPVFAPEGWAPRPGLLIGIENGLGLRHSIAYTTTAALAGNALYEKRPWPEPLPQCMQVVQRITTHTGAPNAQPVRMFYEYDDPAWDGWERRLRGFRKVVMTRGGDAPITSTQTFYFPPAPEGFCGSLEETFSRQNAAAGVALVTEISDARGRYLSTESRSYVVLDLLEGLDGRFARSAYVAQVDSRLYDTTEWEPSDGEGKQDIVAGLREPRVLWTGTVPIRAKRNVLVRKSFTQDGYGNVVKTVAHGRIKDDGGPIDDPIVTVVTRRPLRPDWRFVPERVQTDPFPVRAGVPVDHLRLTIFEQDEAGRLTAVSAVLTGTVPLDRHHQDPTAAVAPAPPGAAYDTVVLLAGYSYDAFDNVTRIERSGNCTGIDYDEDYAQLPVLRKDFTSGCGPDARGTAYSWDRGLNAVTAVTDPNGSGLRLRYDPFGRFAAAHLPDPSTGTPELAPSVTVQYLDPAGGATERVRVERRDAPGKSSVAWSHLDGAGASFLTLAQADKAAGDQGNWIASGLERLSAEGLVTGYYEPWFYDGDPAIPQLVPPGTAVGTVNRDAFGRTVEIRRFDGSVKSKYTYRPLAAETEDAAGRWSRAETDGHGRLIESVRRNVGDLRVSMTYQVGGELARVTQSPPPGAGSAPVVRWMQYDSLGRLVVNAEPNTSSDFAADPAAAGPMKAWRYAYDFSGRLVGTSDARGCGRNLFYDRLGRLVAEDWSPCDSTQAPYSPPNLADGTGVEVAYRYDTPEPDQADDFGVSPQNLVGRLVSVRDRGAHTRWGYDARGRVTGLAVQMARPANADAVWLETPLGRYSDDWFRLAIAYDDAGRPVRASTGASAPELMDASGTSVLSLKYNARGVLDSVGGSYGVLLAGATYDAAGRIRSWTLGDVAGTTAAFDYDLAGRPAGMKVSRSAPPLWTAGAPGYTPPDPGDLPTTMLVLEDLKYQLDSSGKIKLITDQRNPALWPAGAKPVSRIFKHDQLGRLTRVDYGYAGGLDPTSVPAAGFEVPATAGAPRPQFHVLDFDWLGNLRSTVDDYGAFYDRSLGLIQSGLATQGPNQLISAGAGRVEAHHDAAGNLVDLTIRRNACVDSAGLCTHRFVYDWDEVGQLARARRWDYASLPAAEPVYPAVPASTPAVDLRFRYDVRGARVLRSTMLSDGSQRHSAWPLPTLSLRDAPFDSVAGRYGRAATSEEVQLWGLGRVAYAPSAPGPSPRHVLFELRDHLGSTTSVVDQATSELVERRSYQPLGNLDSSYRPARWAGLAARSGFSGKEADGEVGLLYFGARYYVAAMGRWASADPLSIHRVEADLNPYSYVSGDVAQAIDPKGLQACIGAEICVSPPAGFGPEAIAGGVGSRALLDLFGGGGRAPTRVPDPVAPSGSGTKPFDPGANMSGLQRWIWGGSGTFHDVVTSDRNWRALQYYYGGIAITAGTIATGGYLIEALGAAEAAAGSGALFARVTPTVCAVAATAQASGELNPLEQEVEQEFQALTPALQAEVQVLTSRLSQLQAAMHPAAANGGRTLSILRTTRYDVVGSGVRDLPPALRLLMSNQEAAVKLFGEHAEPTVLIQAGRLQQIFPGDFLPRILVTTNAICPYCWSFINVRGGTLFGPRGAVWLW